MPEVRRLLRLLTEPIEYCSLHLHWSSWRRAHQAVARRGHITARARARPAPSSALPMVTLRNAEQTSTWLELTDDQWRRVQVLLPARAAHGRPPHDPRLVLAGVLWIIHRHASWRELPSCFGPWRTIYGHYRLWRQTGLWPRVLKALQNTGSEVSL